MQNLNQKEIRKTFDYDKESGNLIRKKTNKPTGTINSLGYSYARFKGKQSLVHRLVYIWHHGKIPKDYQIDHKDHDRSNNRIENLQLLPKQINLGKHIKSKHRNIKKSRNGSKWIPRITITLGEYDTEEEALEALSNYVVAPPGKILNSSVPAGKIKIQEKEFDLEALFL